jgi:hypothetical protein
MITIQITKRFEHLEIRILILFSASDFEFDLLYSFYIFFDVFNNLFSGGAGLKDLPDPSLL